MIDGAGVALTWRSWLNHVDDAPAFLDGSVKMSDKVLDMLMASDDFISGEIISQTLGVTRTAIWKNINKLKSQGYEIESVRNKGYRLVERTSELVESSVRLAMEGHTLFDVIKVFDSIDSTNTEAKRLWQSGTECNSLIVASEQTKGKGRRGRRWLSPKGGSIAMSMLLTPDLEPMHAAMLTLVAGLAVVKAVRELTALEVLIKWPNDLVVNNKKLCGILTEMSAEVDYLNYVIIGIGINVNQKKMDASIEEMATSLGRETNKVYSRPELIGAIVKSFEPIYEQFVRERNLGFMVQQYNEYCVNVGRQVKVLARGGEIIGEGMGITNTGQLMVKQEDGNILEVNSGEVSVRGLYGYV